MLSSTTQWKQLCLCTCLQVIRISGYIASEKVNIARQYLEPQARQATGVPAEAVTITDPAMKTLISEYAR